MSITKVIMHLFGQLCLLKRHCYVDHVFSNFWMRSPDVGFKSGGGGEDLDRKSSIALGDDRGGLY
jgi:hypothetical protein